MRLQQHINEEFILTQDVIDILMKTNIKYLKDVRKLISMPRHYLQRGMDTVGEHFIKQVRQDRWPVDSKQGWHDALNAEFQDKFHINARSQSVFCSRLAEGYGKGYLIFPIGDFYMLYSRSIPDLFFEQPNDSEDYEYVAKERVRTYKKSDSWKDVCPDINVTTEVMLVCKSYFALSITHTNTLDTWIYHEVK
jgi:hypothetical protein